MKVDTRLVFWGLALFFLSLLTGLLLAASPSFVVNPRGVLAGHLEAAMNGMFVMVVGLLFGHVALSPGLARMCRAALLYSAFANWLFTTLSAVVEQTILVGLVSVALAMLVAVGLLLTGVRRGLSAGAA